MDRVLDAACTVKQSPAVLSLPDVPTNQLSTHTALTCDAQRISHLSFFLDLPLSSVFVSLTVVLQTYDSLADKDPDSEKCNPVQTSNNFAP